MSLRIETALVIAANIINQENEEEEIYNNDEFRKVKELFQHYIKYLITIDPLQSAISDIPIMSETKTLEPYYIQMLEENYKARLDHRFQFIVDYLKYLDAKNMGTNLTKALFVNDTHLANRELFHVPDEFCLDYLKVKDEDALNALQRAILNGNDIIAQNIMQKIPENKLDDYLKAIESFKLAIQGGNPFIIKAVLSKIPTQEKVKLLSDGLELALKSKLPMEIVFILLNEIESFTSEDKKLCFNQNIFFLAVTQYSDIVVKKLLTNCDDQLLADFLLCKMEKKNVLEEVLSKKDINENIMISLLDRIEKLPTAMKILLLHSNTLLLATGTNNIKIVRKVLKIMPECAMTNLLQFQNSIHLNTLDQSLMNRPFKSLIVLEILAAIASLKEADIAKSINKQSLYLAIKTNNITIVQKLLEIAPRPLKKEMLVFMEGKVGVLEAAFASKPYNFEIIEEILTALEAIEKKDSEVLMGESILYLAVCSNRLEIYRRVKNLLPEDNIPFLYNRWGNENCLHAAARKASNSAMIKELLLNFEDDERVEFIEALTRKGSTSIYVTLSYFTYAHIENIKTILEMIPAKHRASSLKISGGIKGYTPLHLLMKKYSSPTNEAIEHILSSIETIEEIQDLLSEKDLSEKTPLDYVNDSVKAIVNKVIAKKRLAEKGDSSSRPHKRRATSVSDFNG